MTKPDTSSVTLDEAGLPVPDPDFDAKRKATLLAYFEAAADCVDEVDEPVLHATDPGSFRDLSARIPGLLVTSAGGACPFQSEGTLHGLPYYFRYRSGYATLDVGGEDHIWEPLYSSGIAYGDDLNGFLDRAEFADLMVRLVSELERAKFRYYFAGRRVHASKAEDGSLRFTVNDEVTDYAGWGTTPEEAFENASRFEPSAYLLKRGWSEQAQRTSHNLRTLNPVPLNKDTRVYPDPEPVFTVRATEDSLD